MNDEQKLNLLRLAVNNASDFEEAKAYASFILRDRNLLTTCAQQSDNSYERTKAVKGDGVYIVTKGLPPVPSGAVGVVDNPEKFDVMVRYHGHEWIVEKHDVSENEISLLKPGANVIVNSPFYKSEIEALVNFDMESCTDHLRKSGLYFKLDDDLYIPTVGQLAAMYLWREELNKALEMVGGAPMKESRYWSSNEIRPVNIWLVTFDAGCAFSWGGSSGQAFVRPCRTIELKKK